ncbi:MAG: multicopper oxidase domain-containing protein, partial [Saprospiraceae bacterium]|nr:multicopper oxidase domain-containing protein [Saprospiraceae bacterium]
LVPELKVGWNSVREGFVDEGWKDTVLVMPGESVKLLLRFDLPDLFLFHCHNLEHEDLGMMRNYRAGI